MKPPVDWVNDEAFCAEMRRQIQEEHLVRMAKLRENRAPLLRIEEAGWQRLRQSPKRTRDEEAAHAAKIPPVSKIEPLHHTLRAGLIGLGAKTQRKSR